MPCRISLKSHQNILQLRSLVDMWLILSIYPFFPFSFPFLGYWFLSVFHLTFFPHDQPISTSSSPVSSDGNCWHILGKIEIQWGDPPRLSCRRENTDLEGIALSKYTSTCQFAILISVWWQKCELKRATMSYDLVIIKQQGHWEIVCFTCMDLICCPTEAKPACHPMEYPSGG